ncbi:MAG: hypothetical protein IH886_16365, partial [Nitrospinae bacterium]|nr:hypothetical protein [Nitrospinota bacterium]
MMMQEKTLEVSHAILRGVLNSLQKNADDQAKADISSLFVEQVNRFMPHQAICEIPPKDESIRENIERLQENGNVSFNELLSEREVKEIRSHLEGYPVFNGHVFGSSDKIPRKLDE